MQPCSGSGWAELCPASPWPTKTALISPEPPVCPASPWPTKTALISSEPPVWPLPHLTLTPWALALASPLSSKTGALICGLFLVGKWKLRFLSKQLSCQCLHPVRSWRCQLVFNTWHCDWQNNTRDYNLECCVSNVDNCVWCDLELSVKQKLCLQFCRLGLGIWYISFRFSDWVSSSNFSV